MPVNIWTPSRADEYAFRGPAMMGAGIARGLESGAEGAFGPMTRQKEYEKRNIFEQMQHDKEREKMEGKLANSIRTTLKTLDAYEAHKTGREPNPDRINKMDYYQAKGELDAIGMENKMAEEDKRMQLLGEQIKRAKAANASAAAFPAFAKMLGEMGQDEENVPLVLSPQERTRRTSPVTPGAVFSAAGATGYDPAGNFDDILRAFAKRGGTAVPGSVHAVPGLEGYMFGVQSDTGSGSFLPLPKPPGGGRLTEVMLGDKPSGWLVNEQGHYLRKAKAEDPFDFAQFDSNNDGELNDLEAKQAMLSAVMKKSGLPYAGMKVKPKTGGGRAAGGKEPSLFDQFNAWRNPGKIKTD